MSPLPLIVRADASSTIGAGHVMRCLALGQAYLARGGRVTICGRVESVALRRELGVHRIDVALDAVHPDLRDLTSYTMLLQREPSIAVVDGYGFDVEYEASVREYAPAFSSWMTMAAATGPGSTGS